MWTPASPSLSAATDAWWQAGPWGETPAVGKAGALRRRPRRAAAHRHRSGGGVPASDDLQRRVSVKQEQWELWTPRFFQGLLFPFTLDVSCEILKWLMTHTWSLEPKVLFVCWAQGSDLCPNLLLLGPFLPRFQGLQGLNSLVYPQEEFNSCEGEKHLWLETIKFPLKEKK